jgi:two-component system OmpR family response regulator
MPKVLSIACAESTTTGIMSALLPPAYEIDVARTARLGMARVMSADYDVVLLESVLTDLDGLTLVSTMRRVGIDTPVLLLGEQASLQERIGGLRAGGDDYMSTPFEPDEMNARVEVLLRRRASGRHTGSRLRVGDLELDLLTHKASHNGCDLDLHPTETRILECLMRHAGEVISRKLIFERVWGSTRVRATNLIDVHISHLRKKVATLDHAPAIRTIRGAGYQLG